MVLTLKDIYNQKNNYFDDFRFILATLVVFYHSYELVSKPEHDFISKTMLGQSSLGEIAVYSFFTISGFFMIQSLENSKTVIRYFRNRIYRIIPAFWFSLIFFSLFIIPLFSNVSFWGDGGSLDFIVKSGIFHVLIISKLEVMFTTFSIWISIPLIVILTFSIGFILGMIMKRHSILSKLLG
ncbi:acyltransferase family protein [Aggregatibacter actinomycetemcomitans]|uniref:acyltransferase family protein n=1 Tax=Aggregatibacter actinomycetemcomitans TaxID=714 RepID=UPI0006A7225B|nr:acyltransferase family protein [Aggregatibacter actinomycetemcomitans]KOE67767.1 hypothetical protein A160_0201000 [Aggregatibacter actinomycetemcomitans serotype e str. A160]KYK73768.1 hypothetical protein SA2876_09495 [Aggregatibacter actinomycetemcomitans serotype e str. SA2876]